MTVSSPVTKDYEESSGNHVEWTPVGGDKTGAYTAHTWGKESHVGPPPHIHSFFRRLKPKEDTSPDTNRLATQSVL